MKEKVFEKYDSRGADYHWRQIDKWNIFSFNAFVYARYIFFAREIKRILKDKDVKIVDFGCGDGVQLYLIKKTLKKYGIKIDISGIDVSEKALSVAQNHLKGCFRHESVYKTSFDNNSFDISISSDVIEHVKDASKMIDEMCRVVKPNGIIIIGTPIKFTEKPLDSMHETEYFQEEFQSLFSNKAADVIDYHQTHPLLLYLLYRKNISLLLGKKLPIFRYLINLSAILFNKNPFLNSNRNCLDQMIYQFIVLKKK